MKIFGIRKEYQTLSTENKVLINTIDVLEKNIANLSKENKEIHRQLGQLDDEEKRNSDQIAKLLQLECEYKEAIKELRGAKGGLKKENNKLKEQIISLKNEIKELKTDKYIVKKLPSEKVPQTQHMKVKSVSRQSSIIKKIREEIDKDV